jgi:PKD repeat protein
LNTSLYCSADTFYFEDYSVLNHSGASWQWSFQNGTPATSTLRNPTVTWSQPGTYWAVLTVTDSSGQQSTDSLAITVNPYTLSATLSEGFEGSFLPAMWYAESAGAGYGWQQANVGGYGSSTRSAMFNNFDIDTHGEWVDMRIGLNLLASQQPRLVFDVAYRQYGGQYADTLQVLVSTDCGDTFTRLYNRGGGNLQTAPALTDSGFVPTPAQWRTDTVSLAAVAGQPNVMLAIRNVGKWGQRLYVDNINLLDSTIVISRLEFEAAPEPYASLYPNPVGAGHSVRVATNLEPGVPLTIWVFDARGRCVGHHSGTASDSLSFTQLGLSAGTYFYRIEAPSRFFHGKLVVAP